MSIVDETREYLLVCLQRLEEEEERFNAAYDITPGWVKDRKMLIRSERVVINRLREGLGAMNAGCSSPKE